MLAAAGIELKPGVAIKVVENTDSLHHLVLPPEPSGELNEANLDKVAGGALFLIPLVIAHSVYTGVMASQAESAAASTPLPPECPDSEGASLANEGRPARQGSRA